MDVKQLKLRMADLCARSEQCEYDIMVKLKRAGITYREAAEIIEALKRDKFLSDSRYARAFANDKVRFSGWGRNKIRVALIAKRIPEACIREALDDIDEDEYLESLTRVAVAKARGLDLSDYRQRQKFYRSMMSRGFESSAITSIISTLREDNM
ncbi:MAG: RecX family transcriptional regulator [Muribaculaceae bacterium]|nr:RecX family transcriptional regulator [Muribaculaceae bacterium]